jgi:NADH:ubiquinone oxidoreductase subunit 2 (subunit N)
MPFDQNFILSNFKDFLPEIIIITTLIIVLVIELIEENSIWLFRVTIGALFIASSVLLFQWFYPNSNTFLSNYHINGLTITFRCLLTLSVTFSVLPRVCTTCWNTNSRIFNFSSYCNCWWTFFMWCK